MSHERVPVTDLAKHCEPFITVRALANYWGVSVRTVRRDIRKGALRVYRLPSGGLRIKREDALAYGSPAA